MTATPTTDQPDKCAGCGGTHETASERNTCEWLDALTNPVDDDPDGEDYERHYGDPDAAYDLATERELCG